MFFFGKRKISICNGHDDIVRVKFTDGKESVSSLSESQVEVGGKMGMKPDLGLTGAIGRTTTKQFMKPEPGFNMIRPGASMLFEAKQPIATIEINDEQVWNNHRIPRGKNNWIVSKDGDMKMGKKGNCTKNAYYILKIPINVSTLERLTLIENYQVW